MTFKEIALRKLQRTASDSEAKNYTDAFKARGTILQYATGAPDPSEVLTEEEFFVILHAHGKANA